MRARPTLALAAACSLVLTGGATTALAAAKPKPKPPPCQEIKDPTGDADIEGGIGNDDSLDLTSVDFGGDKKRLTVVARVAKASLKSAVIPAGSIKVSTYFTLSDTKFFVSVLSDGSTVSGNFGTVGTGSNSIVSFPEAKIDTAKNELRISVPAEDMGKAIYHVGATISEVSTTASSAVVKIATPVVNGSTGGLGIDGAENADYTYKVGKVTCVVPGK